MYTLYWNRIKVIIGISATAMAFACSSKQAIDHSAKNITSHASESLNLANEIIETTAEPDTAEKAESIADNQESIIEESSHIRTSLHGVSDNTPWWARLLQQISIAAIVIGIIVLLWQTGIGTFIKKIFWALGLFIPKRAMRSAEVDLKATDENHPLSFRESIAVRRTSDPAYEYARKKLQKER
tara:strand:+ start:821 stop:1372 length:552 start_codon:yes stop_codon:yes gene_type:complete